ncbi:MAG: DNA-processing protein DprA [Microbacterium sp.]
MSTATPVTSSAVLLDDPRVRELAQRLWPHHDDRSRRTLIARAAWTVLAEPGDGTAGALIAAIGPEGAIETAVSRPAALPSAELREGRSRWKERLRPELLRQALSEALRRGMTLLTPEDDRWPGDRLEALGDNAPIALWVRGGAEHLGNLRAAISIVGARAATGYGTHMASELAAELAGRGVAIISGAAYGIDGAAHRGALGATGLTLAVVAGGVDRVYPAGHARLFAELTEQGAVMSESAPGGAPTKWRFLARNRVIAALGDATVVVEAGERSGALNTAGHAAAMGRPLGAVPGAVTSSQSAGCHRLLRDFDAACVTCADDVLELIGYSAHPPLWSEERVPPEQVRARDALSSKQPRDLADVCRLSGLSVADAQSALGLLELAGSIRRTDTGWLLA